LESQILDATTEDGQKMLHEIEEHEKKAKEQEDEQAEDPLVD
jgi:hypothetical protein